MPDTIDNPVPKSFREMADAIERNADGVFGGAFVVIPPKDGGEPIATLVLDSKQDPAQFWNLLMTKCQIALAEIDQKQRTQATFGRGR